MPNDNHKRTAAEISFDDNGDTFAKILRLEEQIKEMGEEMSLLKEENKTLKMKVDQMEEESEDESDDEDGDSVCDGSRWSKKYFALKQFKQENGHCKVPRANKDLGIWVKDMRANFKKKILSQERLDKLNKIGFSWGQGFPEPPSWEDRFQELEKYHGTFGHVNIHVDPDPSLQSELAKWVVEQRKQGKRLYKQRPSSLTMEQYKRLNGLGFKWKISKSRRS